MIHAITTKNTGGDDKLSKKIQEVKNILPRSLLLDGK